MKYTITARCVEYLTLTVEADSLDEAKRIADESDGGEYCSDPCPDWETYSIANEDTGEITFYA